MWSQEFAGGVRGLHETRELIVVACWNLGVSNEIAVSPFPVNMDTPFLRGLQEFAGGDHRITTR